MEDDRGSAVDATVLNGNGYGTLATRRTMKITVRLQVRVTPTLEAVLRMPAVHVRVSCPYFNSIPFLMLFVVCVRARACVCATCIHFVSC